MSPTNSVKTLKANSNVGCGSLRKMIDLHCIKLEQILYKSGQILTAAAIQLYNYMYTQLNYTRNVGQCPTWWSPCQTYVAPSVQRRKVWLTLTTLLLCSNPAKTWRPLKFGGVPQTGQPMSAASRLKFTILWGHVEDILLLNKFFFRLSIRAFVAKI